MRECREYHRVIEIAQGLPLLVRGGGRVSDAELLARTELLMKQGARGIVYGRNVIQHPNPNGMTKALMAIVHDGATAETAAQHIADTEREEKHHDEGFRFGVIGCGLMGREFASAAARWLHLSNPPRGPKSSPSAIRMPA